MRKTLLRKMALPMLAGVFFTLQAAAQEDKTDEKLSLSLNLNHDAFFGFNPAVAAAYALNDKTALTFYGIQWGAGTGRSWGNWTEFGLGVNFKAGAFDINPQLGFTMGSLLSSGAAQPGVIGDGIVPNLTVNMNTKKMIGQLYYGYYGALQNKAAANQFTNNYVHYWINAGVKATPWLSIGAHFENLNLAGGKSGGNAADLASSDGYQWLGPFVQVSKGVGGMRFSFGGDLTDDATSFSASDFYKLQFFFNF